MKLTNTKDKTKLAINGGTPVRPEDRFLVFGEPFIGEEEIDEVVRCLRSRWIGTGPLTHRLEHDFAQYKGKQFAVALHSGTAALHLSLLASGIGPGDEVITTAMTFCATVNAIIHTGAVPVLADCDLASMNISPESIEERITPRTKAIVVVHFAGRCCDMDRIIDIARTHGLMIIEDAAHAIETEYHGKKTGDFGNLGCFSFYATKNMTTGEGGMIVTDDECLANKIKVLGLHGLSKDAWSRFADVGYKHYEVVAAGFKSNMIDMQAAIGIHQLKHIESNWQRRTAIWDAYNAHFRDLPCILPADPEPDTRHSLHMYNLLVDTKQLGKSRDWFLDALTAENIGIGVHYLPIHFHPYYQRMYGFKMGDYPHAEFIGERTISLPISPYLSDQDVNDVIDAVRKVMEVN